MNVFNRLVVIVVLVALVVVGLVVASVPEAVLAFLQYWTTDAVVTAQDRLASLILGTTMVVIAGFTLYREVRSSPAKTVIVSRMTDGTAALEVLSVAQRIRQQVEAVDGVLQATPSVVSRGKSVDIKLIALTDSAVDVPAKAAEISEVVRDCIGKMGVRLGRQQIHLRYEKGATKAVQRA
ncbi:MAG: hypothetical protein M1296_01855 [Chloroflexi bacterium]|nr:hypothetical protein [Chloroflexota bacterium]